MEAHCIGFGSPPVLDAEQSERWKSKITTVVNDSDMISRMSGPILVNMFIDLLEFDYTEYAMEDVHEVRTSMSAHRCQSPQRSCGVFSQLFSPIRSIILAL